jgi:uncharacterized protein (TIRG00374 family)
MRASSRKLILLAVGACVVGFILYRSRALLHFGDFSGAKLLHAIRDANLLLLVIAVLAIYSCYGLRSLRWQVFQRNLGPSHFWTIYSATLAGFASVFLLGRAGEPVRPMLLARNEKLPLSGMFGIYVLERVFDIASTAVIAGIGLLLFRGNAGDTQGRGALTGALGSSLFLGVSVAIVILIYLRLHGTALLERRLQSVLASPSWKAKVARITLGFARGVQTIRTWGQLVLAVLYSTAHWFLVLLVYFWVLHSFAGPLRNLGLRDTMIVMAFTSLGSVVQLPGVGGGSQVLSVFALTKIFDVPNELAVVAAIVLWLTTFASCSLAGVPLLLHQGWSLGELREMARHKDQIVDQEMADRSAGTKTRQGDSPE